MSKISLLLIWCLIGVFLAAGYVVELSAEPPVDATKPLATIVQSSSEAKVLVSVPSIQAVRGDRFNRANSTDMGPKWIEANGDWRIENNAAHSSLSAGTDLMVFNDLSGSSRQLIIMDIDYGGPARVTYVGAAMGYADLDNNIFVKVQDNDSDGNFEKIFFYYGNNGSPWNGMTGGDFSEIVPPFTSARLIFFYNPAKAQVTLSIDGTTYSRGGIPTGALGPNVAAVGFDNASIDLFGAAMPTIFSKN